MNYQQTLEYLYAQLPMFSRIGKAAYKADLTNTILLCEALGNPQHQFKSIHVAGTNGKGSTSHMLAAMLQQGGYKTGLYTSPHITHFGERIRINGQMIEKDFVIQFTEKTKNLCADIQPSFFELTVAMAFSWFAKEQVDIAVIETGLGGRLDSTNVIQPVLSVITNIGYDHMNLLGDTLEQITFEKAGIIKPNTPVVLGETTDLTRPIFLDKASKENASIFCSEEMYEVSEVVQTISTLTCKATNLIRQYTEEYRLDLTGSYQIRNLRTVLAAAQLLQSLGFPIGEDNKKKALAAVKTTTGLMGRWDVIEEKPTVIGDVGHNQDGIKCIIHQLDAKFPTSRKHFVLGFVNDKDVTTVLKLFPKEAQYYFTNAHIPRAMPFSVLQEKAEQQDLKGMGYEHVNEALSAAKKNAQKNDVIIVCGSFFVLAELDYYANSSSFTKA